MATLQEQITQAKDAGYSAADIAQHLSQNADLAPKIKTAMDAGYKPEEIITHLTNAPKAEAGGPKKGMFDSAIDYIKKDIASISQKKSASLLSDIGQGAGNVAAGLVRGAGSIGATILAPYDMAKDAIDGKGLSLESNRQRRADMDAGLQSMGAQPDSVLYQGGKLAGEIAGTAGAGGILGNGVRAVAPGATGIINALTTGGMKAGATPGAMNMLTRVAGGAGTGATAAGLVNPTDVETGAMVGGALPPALAGVGKAAGYIGSTAKAVIQPFTAKGQDAIAGKIISKFAEGGPTAIDATQHVPGSLPTLAEATGNAGIATLQRGARDLRPNVFIEREGLNAGARSAAFDDVAGNAGTLEFFKASRGDAAKQLYGDALAADTSQNLTPYVRGQITQLLKRPSIDAASKKAQQLAMERGEKPAAEGSLKALQDVKTMLDDDIAEAVRAGKGGHAEALQATKAKLLDVMENLSPGMKEARITYAEMSKPINAMESLQGLKLTDAQGNITLSKVKNAIDGLEKLRSAPGVNSAKSVTEEQLGTLRAIQQDLLRQSSLGAGRSIGSATFQNIATDNILSTMLPDKLGGFASGKIGSVLGQVGKLAYSGPNEAIRNRLADMMLQPELAQNALHPAAQTAGKLGTGFNALLDYAAPTVYRGAPLLSSSR